MKISIITVCYNSARTIRDTISSVAKQKNVEVEHIVVDGASSDGTMDIVRMAPSIDRYISEPDNGIYDAMNKGIALATGDIIGTLNADDFYVDDYALERIAEAFSDSEVEVCYGDLVYVDPDDTKKIVRYWKSRPFRPGLFRSGWMPAHPTFFVRREVYTRWGTFDLSYRIAADVELMMRFLEAHRVNARYLPRLFVKMRAGGVTNRAWGNIWIQNKEVLHALNEHNLPTHWLRLATCKFISRGMQYLSRPSNGT